MRAPRNISLSVRAWREVGDLVDVPRGRIILVTILGATIGATESAFLGILAAVGVQIAGRKGGGVKLPLIRLEGLSTPALLLLGAALALAALAIQFVITMQVARMNSLMVSAMRRDLFRDFSHTGWRVQRSEVESAFVNYVVFHIPRVATLISAATSQLVSLVTLIVFLAGAVAISPVISIVVIALGAILYVIFLPIRQVVRRAGEDNKAATRTLFSSFVDAIAASRDIKTYGVEDRVRERINGEIDELERSAYRSRVASGFVPVLYQRLVFLILLGGLGLVYFLHARDVGSIGASMLIVLRAMQQAQSIQATDPIIAEGLPWVGELRDGRDRYRAGIAKFGDVPLERVDEIEVENVTYTYGEDDTVALKGVSFTARRGELLGIIGPSGSGKSTLSELLVRLDKPGSGSYRVNGRDASDYSRDTWTKQALLVPQLGHLIAASVADNIRFLRPEIDDEAVRAAAKGSHLTEDIAELEDGYETLVGGRGHRGLSGGQRQRIAIARAIAVPPSLIVFDEPTSALDHRAEGVIVETIEALRPHTCVVVVAHRLSTLRHCDRVLVLRDGEVEAFCTPDELAERSPFFREAGTTLAP